MATTIYILILFAGFHFVYESILLPDLIVQLRYRIFKNRDRLILLKAKRKDELDDNIFNAVYTSTNVVIQFLPDISMSMLLDAKNNSRIRTTCNTNNEAELIIKQLHTCSDLELRDIHIENLNIAKMALVYNMGAFFIIFSPIFLFGWLAFKFITLANRFNVRFEQIIFKTGKTFRVTNNFNSRFEQIILKTSRSEGSNGSCYPRFC